MYIDTYIRTYILHIHSYIFQRTHLKLAFLMYIYLYIYIVRTPPFWVMVGVEPFSEGLYRRDLASRSLTGIYFKKFSLSTIISFISPIPAPKTFIV